MKKVGSWKPILKIFVSWKPIWEKNYKLESDFEKLAKLEAFFEKLGSWNFKFRNLKGRREYEFGDSNGETGKRKLSSILTKKN